MKFNIDLPVRRPKSLDELFDNDPYGLLADVGKSKVSMNDTQKIMSELEDIKEFIKEHQRLPNEASDDFEEQILFKRYQKVLSVYSAAKEECEALLPEELRSKKTEKISRTRMTRDEVIKKEVADMHSRLFTDLDSVFAADPLGLLDDVGQSDLVVEHEYWRDTEAYKAKKMVIEEPVAKAVKCHEFDKFKRYFNEVKLLLNQNHVKQVKVVGGEDINVLPGQFFVIDGVLSLIVEGSMEGDTFKKSTGKRRYRVRQIFDNGTESRPFNTSVKASFYKSVPPCMRVVANDDIGREFFSRLVRELDPLFEKLDNAGKPDGYVYILGTLSTEPVIQKFLEHSHLIKIGYTSNTVEERIANAQNESTYLCAPVKVLRTIACKNFDALALENALHTIFAAHRLNVTLKDNEGHTYKPKEWFTVSADTACEVVEHIMAQDLNKYYIDPIQGRLKLKQK